MDLENLFILVGSNRDFNKILILAHALSIGYQIFVQNTTINFQITIRKLWYQSSSKYYYSLYENTMYVLLILNRKFPLYICYNNCYEYERYIDLT